MGEETLTSAFTKRRGKFLRMAMRFFSTEEDAADALQDAFCRLWQRKDEIDSDQEADRLTATTIRNLGIDEWRRRQSQPSVELDSERTDSELDRAVDEALEAKEKFEAVEKIIERHLSPIQQRILHLKEYDGESYEAIAERLGMEPTAVRMQLSRARKTIRMCYQKISDDERTKR